MEWEGIKDTLSDVAHAGTTSVTLLENGSLLVSEEFGRRPGFGARITNNGRVCAEIATYVVFIKLNGNIESELQ